MSRRLLFALVAVVTTFVIAGIAIGAGGSGKRDLTDTRTPSGLPDGFEPAVLRAQNALNRYFVVVDGPSVASKTAAGRQPLRRAAGRRRGGGAPEPGGRDRRDPVARRRRRLSATTRSSTASRRNLSPDAVSDARRARRRQVGAAGLDRPEGERDQRPVHRRAPRSGSNFGVRGQGMVVADVDTGIDYTHANFGGPGHGRGLRGERPELHRARHVPDQEGDRRLRLRRLRTTTSSTDEDPTNDIPRPDPDPLDGADDDHGSHTSGTIAAASASRARSARASPRRRSCSRSRSGTRATRPTTCSSPATSAPWTRTTTATLNDAADVLSFSGGVDYGTAELGRGAGGAAGRRPRHRVRRLRRQLRQPAGRRLGLHRRHARERPRRDLGRGLDRPVQRPDDHHQQPARSTCPTTGSWSSRTGAPTCPRAGSPTTSSTAASSTRRPTRATRPRPTRSSATRCPAGSLSGKTVLVFKGSTGEGDCAGSTKVFNAQKAGARGRDHDLALRRRAERARLQRREHHDPGGDDHRQRRLRDPRRSSAPAPAGYNAGTVNATLNDATTVIPAYTDAMTDFTSEGPARVTNDLKPDIIGARVRHPVDRRGHRRPGDEALRHLDGGPARRRRRHAAAPAPPELVAGADQGGDDEPAPRRT